MYHRDTNARLTNIRSYELTSVNSSIINIRVTSPVRNNERADYFATHTKTLRAFSGSSARVRTTQRCTVLTFIIIIIIIIIMIIIIITVLHVRYYV